MNENLYLKHIESIPSLLEEVFSALDKEAARIAKKVSEFPLKCVYLYGLSLIHIFQTFEAELIQIFPGGIAIGNIESWQFGNSEFNFYVAALCYFCLLYTSQV